MSTFTSIFEKLPKSGYCPICLTNWAGLKIHFKACYRKYKKFEEERAKEPPKPIKKKLVRVPVPCSLCKKEFKVLAKNKCPMGGNNGNSEARLNTHLNRAQEKKNKIRMNNRGIQLSSNNAELFEELPFAICTDNDSESS